MSAIDHFNATLRANPELRREFLMMVAEREAEIVNTAFLTASTIEMLAHARGRVAMLRDLADSYEKEMKNGQRRSEAARRAGLPDAP